MRESMSTITRPGASMVPTYLFGLKFDLNVQLRSILAASTTTERMHAN